MKVVDSVLCFFLLYFIITNKNRLFHSLHFSEKQHSAALAHLLHPRSPAKPSSLHWSSSYQSFARAVRTRGLMHLRTHLTVATPPRNPIESGLNPTR